MSKNIRLNFSPNNKYYSPKNINNLNLNNSKYFSTQSKIEHIMINSDRNSTEKIDEINLIKSEKAKKLNNTFYEKESKKASYNSNNDLPPVNYKKSYEQYKFANTFYNANKNSVKSLEKKSERT
jgi:hypothetical protein